MNDTDKLAHLHILIAVDAASMLRSRSFFRYVLPASSQTASEKFGSKHQEDKIQTELRTRRRGKDEAIKSLHTDISRLMCLAYPGYDAALSR